MITSKPANGVWPGLVVFTLSPASCLLDSDWTVRAIVLLFSSLLCPAVEAVETVGNSAVFCRVFQAQWERWKTCSSFSTVSICAAVSIAWGRKSTFCKISSKNLGHIPLPTSFSPPPNGMAYAVAASFRLNRPVSTTPYWCANCVDQTSAHVRDEATDQAWR